MIKTVKLHLVLSIDIQIQILSPFFGFKRPTEMKLGTHVDNMLIFVYTKIRLLAFIYPFISLFIFLSNFKYYKFCHTFLRN